MTTTKSKHTQGPWHIGVRQPSSDKFVYGSKGEEIADCDRLTNFPDENLANARLIAAAPELLEVCKMIQKWGSRFNGGKLDYEIIEKAFDAIRKAEFYS